MLTLMLRQGLLLTLLASCSAIAFAQSNVKVPRGKPALIDGRFSADEWRDATEVSAPDGTRFYFKQSGDHVFVCLRYPKETLGAVDLYLAPADKKLYTLHASAKLGERTLQGSAWKDWAVNWPWWEISGWYASVLKPTNSRTNPFLADEAKEFQISRQRFTGRQWQVMFDIGSPPDDTVFPNIADKLKSETWIKLKL
jgi:hypothetical protein